MKRAVFAIAVALSGCVSPQAETKPVPQRIMPYSGGLKIADSGGLEISFGRAQAGVEKAIDRLAASAASSRKTAGGCEVVQWPNGLALVFINGSFDGWIAGPPVWSNPAVSAGNTCGLTP